MVSTFINPVINPEARLGVSPFDETAPIQWWPNASGGDHENIIRAVYRHVLGNAHVMESERLSVAESQLKYGELSVREFVRVLAKSELYRSRFFEPCSRYRAIELNFKHLLGRAPDHLEEMRQHSTILDQGGFEAEIDSYLDSDEYQTAFGEDTVPYYRGHHTQSGQSMLEFTNLLQLVTSVSSSDKDLTNNQKARLTRSLILNSPYGAQKTTDVNQLLSGLFSGETPTYSMPQVSAIAPSDTAYALQKTAQAQETQVETLNAQLMELQRFAAVGASVTRQSQFASETTMTVPPLPRVTPQQPQTTLDWQLRVNQQQALIQALQQQIAQTQSLANIGSYRLNKWRKR
jgi:phycoerythrin-associated linker protein